MLLDAGREAARAGYSDTPTGDFASVQALGGLELLGLLEFFGGLFSWHFFSFFRPAGSPAEN